MARNEEMFLLVEKILATAQNGDGSPGQTVEAISRPIRTFLSRDRANEDIELAQEMNPLGTFEVIPVPYIDN